ncbi:MAG TPA: Rrf2 family transcriptional regulator [Acidimicrobiales bacterium]|nr:Rrf2 family transcriptional regulator [Acidimicrobiales bacterium]
MDMTLSKRGDYVMRAAISLARAFDQGGSRKIREVVEDTEVPRTFASQILADLVRADLAVSKAGRDGGYRLRRHPRDITVLEVVEAAEGPLRAERCALGEGPCRWEEVCPLHETWSAATTALRELLAETSLAAVAARDEAIEAGTYAVPADSHRAHPFVVHLQDLVQVEASAPDVRVGLARAGRELPTLLAQATSPEARSGSSRRRRQGVDVSILPVAGEPSNGTAGGGEGYMLAWRLADATPPSFFEGQLSVSALDPERCEVSVSGSWHEEAGGRTDDLERRARATLRSFLRRLAQSLEDGGAPAPARSAAARA